MGDAFEVTEEGVDVGRELDAGLVGVL